MTVRSHRFDIIPKFADMVHLLLCDISPQKKLGEKNQIGDSHYDFLSLY